MIKIQVNCINSIFQRKELKWILEDQVHRVLQEVHGTLLVCKSYLPSFRLQTFKINFCPYTCTYVHICIIQGLSAVSTCKCTCKYLKPLNGAMTQFGNLVYYESTVGCSEYTQTGMLVIDIHLHLHLKIFVSKFDYKTHVYMNMKLNSLKFFLMYCMASLDNKVICIMQVIN